MIFVRDSVHDNWVYAQAVDYERCRIVLHTATSMTAAQALYVTLGFVRAEHLDGLVPAANLKAYTLDLDGG